MATIYGTSGNNNLIGTSGNDSLYGYAGLDTLNGGGGIDTLIGGIGDDTYIVDSTTDVIIELAGGGTDTVRSSVTYTLTENYVNNLVLTGVANLNGTGNSYDNIITGNDGNNYLKGLGGNDTLDGGKGKDTLEGGSGDDTYIVNSTTDIIIELAGGGTDTVKSSVSYTLAENYVNNLVLTGTGNINGTGNSYDNVITGNNGNNTIDSRIGNDTIYGGKGNDFLSGGDYFDGYAWMYGGDGNDTLTGFGQMFGDGGDDLLSPGEFSTAHGGAGNDTLYGYQNATYGDSGNDLIQGSSFNGYGGDGSDTLIAGYGVTLEGGNGNDSLIGNGYDSSLNGGLGNDTLTCYDDELYDSEYGNEHTIVFNAANEGIDTIIDFSSVRDGLEVSASGFGGGLNVGVLKSNQFTTGAAATNSSHRFAYDTATGYLRFDKDGSGGLSASVLAIFQGAPTLTYNDIVVV